jgi:hypothetical protein
MRLTSSLLILVISAASAQADISAYKTCRDKYDPESYIADASILYGLFTGGFLSFLGGSATKKRIADQIMKECWPLLSDEEQRDFLKEAKQEIDAMKWEKKPR